MAKTKIAKHKYEVALDAVHGDAAIGAEIDDDTRLVMVSIATDDNGLSILLDHVGILDLESTLRHLRYSLYGRDDNG
jgi:hypothetical protein